MKVQRSKAPIHSTINRGTTTVITATPTHISRDSRNGVVSQVTLILERGLAAINLREDMSKARIRDLGMIKGISSSRVNITTANRGHTIMIPLSSSIREVVVGEVLTKSNISQQSNT